MSAALDLSDSTALNLRFGVSMALEVDSMALGFVRGRFAISRGALAGVSFAPSLPISHGMSDTLAANGTSLRSRKWTLVCVKAEFC